MQKCPSCESKNVIVYEKGEDDSYCLDCDFTWRHSENYMTVSRKTLERLAGLDGTEGKQAS
ncbi:MAG: hypothetical protein ABR507_07340 [Actinomycetota bacterium]|nr:hypothetical protein [Actinomycetota bacterium]